MKISEVVESVTKAIRKNHIDAPESADVALYDVFIEHVEQDLPDRCCFVKYLAPVIERQAGNAERMLITFSITIIAPTKIDRLLIGESMFRTFDLFDITNEYPVYDRTTGEFVRMETQTKPARGFNMQFTELSNQNMSDPKLGFATFSFELNLRSVFDPSTVFLSAESSDVGINEG